jgi:uncharacterized SAM-binding protein YcdF (DUF218 family)
VGLILFINKISNYDIQDTNTAQAAIVLTGGDKRIEEGVRVLKQKLVARLFITGVDYKVRHKREIPYIDELHKMDNIEIGKEATTTTENAIEAKDWIVKNQIKTAKIVTANYHMPRSILEFRYRIHDVEFNAHPVFPEKFDSNQWWHDKNTVLLVLKEYTKYIYVLFYTKIF